MQVSLALVFLLGGGGCGLLRAGGPGGPSARDVRLRVLERNVQTAQERAARLEAQLQETGNRLRMLERELAKGREATARLEGEVRQLRRELKARKVARPPAPAPLISRAVPPPPPLVEPPPSTPARRQSPQAFYTRGLRGYKKGTYSEAVRIFREFRRRYPRSPLADNALYWEGESFYKQKQYREALAAFDRLLRTYPRGNKRPDALLKRGFSLLALGNVRGALLAFERLIDEFPDHRATGIARRKVEALGRRRKGQRSSRP
ncbi:MAG: tol-pal system protein YbgF [Nitrospinota bacterium]